jgi:taurine dioxygenase
VVLGDGSGSPVVAISNAQENALLGSADLPAHSEFQYLEEPLLGVLLYAAEVPASGGDTSWSNLHLAYRRLDRRTRRKIDGLRAWSLNPYSEPERYRGTFGAGQQFTRAPAPRVLHPVVRTHPVTGRKLLAVSRLTAGIEGLGSAAESAELLLRLQRHVDRPRLYYRHRWRAGDLVVFDNRCTNHKRSAFDPRQRRLLYRVQIAGTRPF